MQHLQGLVCIYDVHKICAKYFFEGKFCCALRVFSCVLVSRSVCMHTRAQLRGNIDSQCIKGTHRDTVITLITYILTINIQIN